MDYTNALDSLAKTVEEETIKSMLKQLNNLVNANILTIKTGDKNFFYDKDSAIIKYENCIEIQANDKEYIQKLEFQNDKLIGENKRLRELIKTMAEIAGET